MIELIVLILIKESSLVDKNMIGHNGFQNFFLNKTILTIKYLCLGIPCFVIYVVIKIVPFESNCHIHVFLCLKIIICAFRQVIRSNFSLELEKLLTN